jgi:class 3 adenylate cyclase/tetratricopeptide (TPR) repeat protein
MVEHVDRWLETLGLGKYAALFSENEITVDVVPRLTEADLKELGLPLGPRRVLSDAIQNLTAAKPAADASPTDRPAAPAAAEATKGQAERRQLTVMFVDLVGSTALSAKLDPEEMGAVLRGYQNAVAGEITRFEGHVAKFMGDGVLAYFGWPVAHEDEAERAVRAGLAVCDAVSRVDGGGSSLACRIGIATGLVMVGDLVGEGAAQEQAVVGDTPNLAARLQVLAEPGQVVIAEATRRLVGEAFVLATPETHELKGIDGTAVSFAVLEESTVESRFAARGAGAISPMEGREQELDLLLGRWARARSGEGEAVLLVGEAGIGKSRISRALLDKLEDEHCTSVRYQCSPYHTDSALWPVIRHLDQAAGVTSGQSMDERLDRLEALLGRTSDNPVQAAPLFARLLGLAGDARYGPLDLSPQALRNRTLAALVEQLTTLAARQPVLVLVEDVHWIDPTTLELIELWLDRIADSRVLMLLTSRPDNQPRLAAHPHVTRLTLNRLGRSGVEAIVARLSGGDALAPELVDDIIERTDGVPLFVEEMTKAVLESGLASVPATLHDSLMARLDRVPEVKAVAQIAAVIGRVFDHAPLAAIAELPESQLLAALDKLMASELVFRRGTPPEATYTFKHALVRDAAYESLLKTRRRELHAALLAVLTALPDTSEELLGYHAEAAGLVETAIGHWRAAGEQAAERSANEEAIRHFEHALKLLATVPATEETSRVELDTTLSLAFVNVVSQGYSAPGAVTAYARARRMSEQIGDSNGLTVAMWSEYTDHLVRGDVAGALRKAHELMAHAEATGAPRDMVMALRSVGIGSQHAGLLDQSREALERVLELVETHGDKSAIGPRILDARVAARINLAHVLLLLGFPEKALARQREAGDRARTVGDAPSVGYFLGQTSLFSQHADNPQANAEQLDESIAYLREQGLTPWHGCCLVQRGLLTVLEGHRDTGLDEMRSGLQMWQRGQARVIVPLHLIQFSRAHAALREWDTALGYVTEALTLIGETGEEICLSEAHRLWASLLLSNDRAAFAEAEVGLQSAIDVARRQNARWPELRASHDLARLWAERGERQQALDLLVPVYDWFTEGFDTPDLVEAKALLDELR